MGNSEPAKFLPFHFVKFASLTSLVKDETDMKKDFPRAVITVTPATGTLACMALMSQKKIRHLPVLDGSAVLGMISIRDIMNDIIAGHEKTISELTSYINS